MLRSLFSGITGLRQHQTLMDVVSNNISNVNTTGYKSSSVVFEDTLSQMVRQPSSPNTALGGLNPEQVGLGVQLGGISTNFAQGSAQNTGKSTDLMIQGDGFFVVRNGTTQEFTRAGAFTFDSTGTLVNPNGFRVQGWTATKGVLNSNATPADIVIPAGTLAPPTASSNTTIAGNIAIDPANTDVLTFGPTVYDAQGKAHNLTITLTNDGTGAYDVAIVDAAGGETATNGKVVFDAAGNYDSTASSPSSVALADGTNVVIDLTKATHFGGPKSLNVTAVDGAPAGTLQGFQIGTDGSITGTFSNGQKLLLAQVALANFTNPAGLEKAGDSAYVSTTNSGPVQINPPGAGGVGTILAGSLEMSNVDLAQEFTNLIIAQRGFQANSRVITTSDQILQDLVDIKR
ncbi:MAG TPA: flagellar hook protein FlgE [Kineosporiaceae bacterium]|nr:flagellar hook protein FlgE [Kineosporiaceae bacterium]